MGDFRKLEAWQAARRLAVLVHQATAAMPWRERAGLGDQMRRSAVSVASNIAEGAGRASDREFARFLRIARGSLQELQTQLLIAADLTLLPAEALQPLDELAARTGRLLFGLLRYRTHGTTSPTP
jgi:four helix bundle protein